jgi:bacteriocin-like protein
MFIFKKKSLAAKGEKQTALPLRTLNEDELQAVNGGRAQASPSLRLQCCSGTHIPTATQ